jgi:hypothetical protein
MPIPAILALLFLANPAQSAEQAVTTGPYPACTSEAKLKEATQALKANDEQRFNSIGGCVITKPGLDANVLSRGKTVSKVELFSPSGKGLVVWTDTKNINPLSAGRPRAQSR